MRFEHKHQYFKKCIKKSRNFINVTGMLAFQHQMLQAYLSASPRFCADTVEVRAVVNALCISNEIQQCLCVIAVELVNAQLCTEVIARGTIIIC